ncbi:GNAT family N-acetyltransferase [Kamptonema formosum]|uniref:GNAT family N-acetyltransferase n=1 Tax=Kamptonema formosum TaxID=331992 RepID=UPI00035EFB21|nr:GNAT family N-acetyltransferase [Oscillatoria sp. PCC 10802]
MEWTFCSIDDDRLKKNDFDCGVPALNDYLIKYARQNHKKGIAKTFVAIANPGNWEVAGYYSLSMGEIEFESLPERYRRGLPRYPLPAVRIGKLAVSQSMQGRRLGEKLLMDALNKAVRLSQDIGVFAVTVDALNEPVKQFYLKYGFLPLENSDLSLFIPIRSIVGAFESAKKMVFIA